MPARFSRRSSFDLVPNRLTGALTAAREAGRRVLDLTESNPTRAAIPYAGDAILGALASPDALVYEPESFGLARARTTVGAHLKVDPSRVLLTASTSEAYAFLFKLLCDAGDQVLVPAPSYPLFEHLARLEHVEEVTYRLAYDGAWHVDLDSVRAAAGPRARAIVVVTPNNPTGSFLKRDELRALAELGLPIVSDEVFASFPLRDDPRRATTVLEHPGRLAFALGGLSKLALLPQMKLGWTAVGGEPSEVQAALARLEIVADAFLSVGAPVQHALPTLLSTRYTAEDAVRARTRENLAFLRDLVRDRPVSLLDVEGGWYATLRLPATRSEEDWTLRLLERDGVHVHPGHYFDFEREPYVVLSLLTEATAFREGCERLVARVTADAG